MKVPQLNTTQSQTYKTSSADSMFSQQQGAKVFIRSLKLTMVLAVLIIIGLVISYAYTNLESVDKFITTVKPWLLFWRMLVFLALIAGWSQWSVMYAQWAGMNKAQIDRMLGCRWRISLWLLIMEAVLSQGVLIEFVNNLVTMDTAL